MSLTAQYLREKHSVGLTYDAYCRSGKPEQLENWRRVYAACALTADQRTLLAGFTRRMNVIALSGIWCGDCVQQGPLIQRIAEASPQIDLRWLDRDVHRDLQAQVRINAGDRVPVLLFCAEDYELVGWYGDRTLSRYRMLARKQLGAACPLPGAAVDDGVQAATLAEWLNEFERVQWLLRLSARLRQAHQD